MKNKIIKIKEKIKDYEDDLEFIMDDHILYSQRKEFIEGMKYTLKIIEEKNKEC